MPFGCEESECISDWQRSVRARKPSQHRHTDAEKTIAFAVLAGAGLEEPLKVDRVGSVGLCAKVATNGTKGRSQSISVGLGQLPDGHGAAHARMYRTLVRKRARRGERPT